jgi:hypothetical protein
VSEVRQGKPREDRPHPALRWLHAPAALPVLAVAIAALVACSVWQQRALRELQLQDKKALYAERLRTAQVIIENELLAGAYLTTLDDHTRERARHHLQRSPQ